LSPLRLLEGFTLGNYLLLVDYTGRLVREGKAAMSRELGEILERLGNNVENWEARPVKLSGGRLLGRFVAASRECLRAMAHQLGVRHIPNLGGVRFVDRCPERWSRSCTQRHRQFATVSLKSRFRHCRFSGSRRSLRP
jgi:hypothetical protein